MLPAIGKLRDQSVGAWRKVDHNLRPTTSEVKMVVVKGDWLACSDWSAINDQMVMASLGRRIAEGSHLITLQAEDHSHRACHEGTIRRRLEPNARGEHNRSRPSKAARQAEKGDTNQGATCDASVRHAGPPDDKA
jgi:hypothetical protein